MAGYKKFGYDYQVTIDWLYIKKSIVGLFWLAAIVWSIFMIVHYIQTPYLPYFSVVSASTTVENICESNHHVRMDLNVSFMVHNPNKAGAIVCQDMKALVFQYGEKVPIGFSNNDIDFEQLGSRRSTKWFRLQNTTAAIDAWVDNYGDNPTYGKSGKLLALQFELRGDSLYKGKIKYWSEKKSPIKVVCDEVDLLFSSNATRAVAFKPIDCRVHAPWGEVKEELEVSTFVLLFLAAFLLVFVTLILWFITFAHDH